MALVSFPAVHRGARLTSFLALAVASCFSLAQTQLPPGFKAPLSKEEEIRKFHTPPVKAMPAEIRMRGYEQRLKMERDGFYSQLKWRNVGPEHQGGRVVDFEWSPGTPSKFYVAFATGGLWRTEDDGINWTPLFDNESCFAIGDVAISKDGSTIWIGTGENNNQRTSYSGTGIFKSTDGGKTWTNMGLWESHRIGRVLIDPKDENTVYVAASGHLYSQGSDRGVYKTTDGGKTWQLVLKVDENTGCIDVAMDSKNPDVLVACMYDRDRRAWNFRESGPGSGIYRSENGGRSWTKIAALPSGTSLGRAGVASAPSKTGVFYVFLENQGPDPDVYSADEGAPSGDLTFLRFTKLTEDMFLALDRKVLDPFARANFPTDAKVDEVVDKVKSKQWTMKDVFALIEKRRPNAFELDIRNGEVYRTDDGGKKWRLTCNYRLGDFMGYYCGRVVVSPKNENDIAITGLTMARSRDGGKTWEREAERVHSDQHAFWYDPRDSKRMWNGNDGGIYVSKDEGKSWKHVNNIPVGQFTTIATDNKLPYNIAGGLQDNGTQMGPSTYVAGLSQISLWRSIGGGDGSALAFDPRDNDVVYVASQFGAHQGRNLKTNESWNARPGGGGRGGPGEQEEASGQAGPQAGRTPALRFNWVSPLIVSPHHPDILYCGANRLFRSLNMGRSWEAISPDLTTQKEHGDVPFSTLKDVSESPLKFGLIYAGTDDGLVWVTKDHGGQWESIDTPGKGKWVSRVVASKWDVGTVYVSQSGYREDDFAAYLWKSTDYGKTWTSIAGGLPTETINVIREDPNKKGFLYVGTDLGVFVSIDDGKTWDPLNGGIPRTPVHDLAVQARDNDLVIGTHARSVWVLNIKPILDLTDEIRAKELHVWAVDGMRRDRRWGHQPRSGYVRDLPTAPVVRGRFWSRASGKGKLAIKDKDGKVVKEKEIDAARGFNNYELDLELKPGKPILDDPAKRDLKTLEDVLKDPFWDRRPEYLAAGEYKIEISVGATKAEITWKLTE